MKSGGQLVCLVKPQFEAGRGKVGKNGVVKDAATHRQVLCRVVDYADLIGFQVAHLTFSPIRTGGKYRISAASGKGGAE